MKKIKSLVKYEIIEIIRNKMLIIIFGLMLFGFYQIIESMKAGGTVKWALVTFLKDIWLPINFVYIPVIIIAITVAKQSNDLFNIYLNDKNKAFYSKIIVMIVVNSIVVAIFWLAITIVSIISKTSFQNYLYNMVQQLIIVITALNAVASIGLFVGRFIKMKFLPEIISLFVFFIINNFYKYQNVLLPLFYGNQFKSTFQLVTWNKMFIYHILFWNILTVVLLIPVYIKEKKGKLLFRPKQIGIIIIIIILLLLLLLLLLLVMTGLGCNSIKFMPEVYMNSEDDYGVYYDEKDTFNEGFLVKEYTMDISIDEKLANKCDMKIQMNSKDKEKLILSLYEGFKIKSVLINGMEVEYDREDSKIIVDLNDKYNSGSIFDLTVIYEGRVNMVSQDHGRSFFADTTGIYLADYFDWYPKPQYKGNMKKYTINMDYNSKNKVYSNLEEASDKTLSGEDLEVFLISGRLTERKYKNLTFVGNEEQVNSDEKCENILKIISQGDSRDLELKNTIILTPMTFRQYTIFNIYTRGYLLFGFIDLSTVIN